LDIVFQVMGSALQLRQCLSHRLGVKLQVFVLIFKFLDIAGFEFLVQKSKLVRQMGVRLLLSSQGCLDREKHGEVGGSHLGGLVVSFAWGRASNLLADTVLSH
jgi:hypothetical protein